MLVKWQPFESLLNNHDVFSSIFDTRSAGTREFAPQIEIRETDKNFVIEAELPGLTRKDFKLTVENNTLILEGEKKLSNEEKKQGYYRSERAYGTFRRSFRMTDELDSRNINADFSNGVLNIEIPKAEKAKPKQIEVKVR
jgi:HSP20 family protein